MGKQERLQLAADIISMTTEQFEETVTVVTFIFSLPEHQQDEAVRLYKSGMCIEGIAKLLGTSLKDGDAV